MEEEIVSVKIFPPIGIARVGNSPNDFFIGPEIPGVVERPDGGYKDEQGRIKRQAARFRLYGYDRNGDYVKEITSEDAHITWNVHLAHKKAASMANSTSQVIDPGEEFINGPLQQVRFTAVHFEHNETISPNPVNLGEIRTDEVGRLIVLGGQGISGNQEELNHTPNPARLRNEGYYDDTSDGSINATVILTPPNEAQREVDVMGAWVIVSPPDFAPEINSAITLYDRLLTYHNTHGLLPENFPLPFAVDYRPSFNKDISPLLKRAWEDVQEVMDIHPNQIIQLDYDLLSRLPVDEDEIREASLARRDVMLKLRNNDDGKIPRSVIDDNIDHIDGMEDSESHLTAIQLGMLSKWSEGNFLPDWTGSFVPNNEITPEGLTQAALDSIGGTRFGPGLEVGDNMLSNPTKYIPQELLRINQNDINVEPGHFTEELGVPWHIDFFECGESTRDECQEWVDLSWWPAQRPTSVLNPTTGEKMYWLGSVQSASFMISRWSDLGYVAKRDTRFEDTERYLPSSITLLTPQLNFSIIPIGNGGIYRRMVQFIVLEVFRHNATQNFEVQRINDQHHFRLLGPERKTILPDEWMEGEKQKEIIFPIEFITDAEIDNGIDEINSFVEIRHVQTGNEWSIPLSAKIEDPVRNAISLVLDRSGSMSEDRGDGMAKVESLKKAASTFINLMELGDGLSVTAFSEDAESLTLDEDGDPAIIEIANEDLRENLIEMLNDDPRLTPRTTTSIGDGILMGKQSLENANGFNRNAMVILTDGVENAPTLIHDVAHLVNSETYAIGLGQATNVNVSTLQHLTGNHGGYLLLTGDIEGNNRFRLEKHFMQVLTGIEQKEIVYDPDGTLLPGQTTSIPFIISDAENTLDAILLSTHGKYIKWHLISPNGYKIDPETAREHDDANFRESDGMSFFRLSLPFKTSEGKATSFGEWKAVISHAAKKGAKPIHYNFNVHAHSQLSFRANGYQEPHNPFNLKLEASVMQYVNLPVENASVTAEVTTSDGQIDRFVMQNQKPGKFAFEYQNAKPGVHHIRLMARGTTFRGTPFQREQTLSFPVVLGGEKPQTDSTWELDIAKKPKPSYRIYGKVIDSKGKGIPNLIIKAVDQDFTGENALGKDDKTDGNGNYSIPYALKDFAPHGKEMNGADIILYIQNSKGETIHATKPLRNAKKVSRINATLTNQ